MSFEIKIADKTFSEKWDNAIFSSSTGTIFHTWRWLEIVEKHTDSRFYPLMIYKGTNLIGIYPVFLKKFGVLTLAFSPPPKAYLLYLGPVILDYDNLKLNKKEVIFLQLQKEVDRFLSSELKCKYINIHTPPGLIDTRPFRWCGYNVEPYYTYRINLKNGLNYAWEQFDRKLRVDINKAIREGVRVDEGGKEDMDYIYSSLSRRFEKVFDQEKYLYLLELYDEFYPDKMKIFIARYKGDRVGGIISLCHNKIMYLWIGVPKADLKGISPNDLVQWEAIKWACNNGFKYYEEMDSGDERLRFFKTKYNPELSIWFLAVKYSWYIGIYRNIKKLFIK